jgi:hypothetical protein
MKTKSFSINFTEAEIEKEFYAIKKILEGSNRIEKHNELVSRYGLNYRTIAFHVIDNAPGVYAPQREDLLQFFHINMFTDGDDGAGSIEDTFDDSEIVEKCLQEIGDKEYLELLNRVKMQSKLTQLKGLYGIDLESNSNDLIKSKKSNTENSTSIHGITNNQYNFENVQDLSIFLNHWSAKYDTKEAQKNILALLNFKPSENEQHWLALELSRRNYLIKSISSGIESDLSYNSHIHQWDLCIDDEIKNIIESIDTKILSFINYHTSAESDQLKKIQLKAKYLGVNVAVEELKKIIMENDIQDAEYFLQMVNWYEQCDDITEAEVWIEYSQKLKSIPIGVHLEFMYFYVRFDHGYRQIAKYVARILPQLDKEDRRGLVPFLLKQIDVGYLDKNDLSPDVIAEIVLYQNELN